MEKSQNNTLSNRSEFWGICCESGKRYSQVARKKFHISMAALDSTVKQTSSCVSLFVERGGCEYLLCNLKPDSILQVNLDLYFDKGEKVTFSLKGQGTVHLSGYHIFSDGEPSLSENLNKSPLKSNSGTVKSSETSSSEESSEEEEEEEPVATPKKNPGLRKAASSATGVKTQVTTPVKKAQTPKADLKKAQTPKSDLKNAALLKRDKVNAAKRMRLEIDEESSDDDDEESSEDVSSKSSDDKQAQPNQKLKDFQNKKRLKTDTSTPLQGKKTGNQNTPKLFTEVIDLEDDGQSAKKSFSKGELNSSVGRTPMPKKSVTSLHHLSNSNDSPGLKKSLENEMNRKEVESSDSESDEMNVSSINNKTLQSSAAELDTSTQSTETKKKKKKKKKNKASTDDSKVGENTPSKANESVSLLKSGKKLPGGVEYEDIRAGHGLEAKKGKLVHVYYTGKLENNKVFDSVQPGSKPLSFKLGSGQVIKGWDIGVEGMKVGGKRKLKIPPHMGYKSQRMGEIPPNSTLHFVVELKAVS